MRKIKEVIVVEGRYDKNTLAQVVDATVVTLGGFSVFNDKEKVAFLRRLAAERGLIVLTDSDGAGFVIRNYLKGALPKEKVKQAYIPDIHGKEKRKRAPGKEGKLGVEGMKPEVILEALRRAGATFLDEMAELAAEKTPITKADLMEWGLAGGAAPTAGSAGAPDRQRDAGGAEPADRPGGTGGTAARPMREENFPPKIRREVLRSVPYVLFEERPSKFDGDDPAGYGEQYRSFVGGRQPSELPKGAADRTQDRKGEEDL